MESCSAPHCLICGKFLPVEELTPAQAILPPIARLMRRDHPRLTDQCSVCAPDLARYRAEYMKSDLSAGFGVMSDLESDVLRSVREDQVVAEDLNRQLDARVPWDSRLVKGLMARAGLLLVAACLLVGAAIWVAAGLPGVALRSPAAHPLMLAILALSAFAALLAPLALIGLRQTEARERLKADLVYKRALKAEIAERHLEERLDHLLALVARQGQILSGGPDDGPGGDVAQGHGDSRRGAAYRNGAKEEPPHVETPPRRLKLVP